MENEQLSSNILVAVRIRPLSSNEKDSGHRSCCQSFSGKVVAITKKGDQGGYLKSQQPLVSEYAFDEVFDETCSQRDVYERTTKRYINYLLDGQNVTVFAYGATGAGKTHTMLGNTRADAAAENAEAGIIPNAVKDVFSQLQQKQKQCTYGESYKVFLSFLEVYNEQVYDLLEPSGRILSVREDKDKGIVTAAGMTEQLVTSYEQVIDFIIQGNKQRKTEATMANVVSSRSHAILQLSVRHTIRTDSGRDGLLESKLSLIDLAGSERASATNNRGARLQEGANINKSLLALANCINALAENANSKKNNNVKYRDSKLTHLLRSSLEGNGHLVMIANVNPCDHTYEDSHNTLKYANRAKNIKVNPAVKGIQIKETNWVEREAKLREENNHLRQTIRQLEDKIIELEYFKSSVLANNGILPPDFELIESVNMDGADLPAFDMNESQLSEVFELSVSSSSSSLPGRNESDDATCDFQAATALKNAFPDDDLVASMDDDITQPICCESPPSLPLNKRKGRESLLPTMAARRTSLVTSAVIVGKPKMSSTIKDCASIAEGSVLSIAEEKDKEDVPVDDATEELSKGSRKRRASFLPTRTKRQSIETVVPVPAPIIAVNPTSSVSVDPTPVIAAPSAPKPTNPMAWATEPDARFHVEQNKVQPVNTTPIPVTANSAKPAIQTSDEPEEHSMPVDDDRVWLDDGTHFELGAHTKPITAAASGIAAGPKPRRASISRSSISGGSFLRRKSIAQVSAMLDSLQNDVAASLTSFTVPATNSLPAASPSVEESTTPSSRVTRSKVLQTIDPNVTPAETVSSKPVTKDRRKSIGGAKTAAFSVDAVTLTGHNNENSTPAAPLRRSTRRASLSAQAQHAWIDV